MKTIALLTDFGLTDHYVGVMKGVILGITSRVGLVDIAHSVSSHNIREAAFLLAESFSYFPRGTVFLAVVDPGVGSRRQPLAIETKNYFFVGPDNGLLSLAAERDRIKTIVALDSAKYWRGRVSRTFHGRDVFAPAAAYLAGGRKLVSLGRPLQRIKKIDLPGPELKEGTLTGEVVYIDKFGNIVTNIRKAELLKFLRGGEWVATLKGKKIRHLLSSYSQSKVLGPFFIEGSSYYLEISLKDKSAKRHFGLKGVAKNKIIVRRLK